MPRVAGTKEYNTFVKGLITEASPLTFPENSSIDEDNCALNRDGTRQRRLGIDYEANYVLNDVSTSDFQDKATTVHRWSNPGNSGSLVFAVVQIGDTLHFHDALDDIISTKLGFTLDLKNYKANPSLADSEVGKQPISGTSGNGAFFVTSRDTEPFYIEYDTVTESINAVMIDIKIRDFEGVDDGLDVDERPTTLSDKHKYNLENQGWYKDVLCAGTSVEEPIEFTYTHAPYGGSANNFYPSNADVLHLYKGAVDEYNTERMTEINLGNTPAAKGHYILDAFNRDRVAASEDLTDLIEIPAQVENNRPEATAFYSGRVFFAGIESTSTTGLTLNSDIFFSPILTDFSKVGQCYQEADPTSEDQSDLVDTDGGVLTITEAGKILKLEVIGNVLLVIADNGIWSISGIDGVFTASGFVVNKITSIGCISRDSIVNVESSIMYWSLAGIYTLVKDEVSESLSAKNITENTIQTFYTSSIPEENKKFVKGVFDTVSRKIHWLFNSSSDFDGLTYKYKYDRELLLDTVLGAFYTNTFATLDSNSPFIFGGLILPRVNTLTVTFNLIDGSGNNIQDGSGNDVVLTENSIINQSTSLKYLVSVPNANGIDSQYTVAELRETSFFDWITSDSTGKSYDSFLVTGHELFGDTMRNKQGNYLVAHFNQTETGYTTNGEGGLDFENESGCLVQTRWGWTDSTASGRWSTPFQAYRLNRNFIPDNSSDNFDNGESVVTTKSKIRGNGKSLSLYFQSEEGKDFQLLGWGTTITGGSVV